MVKMADLYLYWFLSYGTFYIQINLFTTKGQFECKKCHNSGTDKATDLPFSPYVLEFLGLNQYNQKRAIFET